MFRTVTGLVVANQVVTKALLVQLSRPVLPSITLVETFLVRSAARKEKSRNDFASSVASPVSRRLFCVKSQASSNKEKRRVFYRVTCLTVNLRNAQAPLPVSLR